MTTVVLGVPKGIWRRVRRLLTQPVFVVLTVMGNGCILAAAGGLYALERDTNPGLRNFVDALWWAVSTVTTVGYGDVVPLTTEDRLVGIALMIVGTALFWSYTALFATIMVMEELAELQRSKS